MLRRTFLLAGAANVVAPAAHAFGFAAAARYSAERRGVSLLVMRDGRVMFEDYPNAGGPDRGWELASGAKSFTGIMAAAAVADGLMRLDERIAETVPAWRADPRKSRITVRQLLTLSSGIEGGRLLRPETYAASLDTPAQHEPGAHFAYGPAPFQIFGEVLRRKLTRDADPVAYLQRRVLDPLEIAPTQWRRGRDGLPFMPQGAHFTARAWARFGQFVLEGGRGLVDRDALAACFDPTRANPGYGLSWWLLRPGLVPPSRGAGVEISAAEAARLGEVNMAAGAGDQRLYLLPERGLVVARQANQIFRGMRARGEERWSDAEFLRLVLEG